MGKISIILFIDIFKNEDEKVYWGILGTAQIAIKKVIPAMLKAEFCSIDAIASRRL